MVLKIITNNGISLAIFTFVVRHFENNKTFKLLK